MHLTSTAICASGRQFVDWSADYRLCSRSPWEPYRLFDPVFDHLPSLLASPTAPVIAALDDTLCKKTGRHYSRSQHGTRSHVASVSCQSLLWIALHKTAVRPRRYGPLAPTPEQIFKDDAVPVHRVPCFAAGQLREIPVKVLRSLYWRKAGADVPLQLVVIKPLGYRLRNGSKLLYRQPAFLICTDLELSLQALVQSYLYRWEIECNHRDEKSLLGVAQGQVWNPHAVRRLPQLQVAGYSLLLLSSLLSSGFQGTAEYLPLPKWRRKSIRPSLLDLLALRRDQIFNRASGTPPLLNFDDFKTAPAPASKSSKQPLASDTLCTFAA